MLIRQRQTAPEGSAFSRWAFDDALGKSHPFLIEGKEVGEGTLVGAIPSDDHHGVELVWEIDALDLDCQMLLDDNGELPLDDFDAGDMFNPARAIRVLQAAGTLDEARHLVAEAVSPETYRGLVRATSESIDAELHTARQLDGRLRRDCVDGKEHGAVLTASDDIGKFDSTILGPTPNDHQYGYCADCKEPFRWSVSLQRWRRWPGDATYLPALDDEELDVLAGELRLACGQTEGNLMLASSPNMRRELNHRLAILNSLATAVQEARYGLV